MRRTTMMAGAAIIASSVIFQAAIPATAATTEPTIQTDPTPEIAPSGESETPPIESLPVETPPVGDAATETAAVEDAAVEADVDAMAGVVGRMTARIEPSRVTLSEGRESGERKGQVTVMNAAPSSSGDSWRIDGTYNVNGGNSATGLNGTVDYRISMLGQPTNFWVRTQMYEWFGYQEAGCTIFDGDPEHGGVTPAHYPYLCNVTYPAPLPDGHVTFSVVLNRVAEASGVIRAGDDVHLEGGSFQTDNQIRYAVPGAASIATNGSTAFDTVLLESESPTDPKLARTSFSYRIASGGVQTRYWVAGYVSNLSGKSTYTPDAQCHIYIEDPTGKALSKLSPQDVTPYACDITTRQVDGIHHSHIEATFAVSKRVMKVEHSPQAQQNLIQRVCGEGSNNCGLSLSNVTEYRGPETSLSDARGNPSKTEDLTFDVQTSVKQGITNTVGVTVSQGFETTGLWGTYKATLELSWGISISHEITHTQTDHAVVPPGRTGHLAGAPTMIRAAGSVIVRDGDIWWELPGVSMDIPKANGWLIYTTDDGPFTPPITETPTPGDTDVPAVINPALAGVDSAATTSTATRRVALAATGGSLEGTGSALAAAGVLLAAGGLMVLRRRRHNTH